MQLKPYYKKSADVAIAELVNGFKASVEEKIADYTELDEEVKHCLSLPFTVFLLPFHCLSLSFHCLPSPPLLDSSPTARLAAFPLSCQVEDLITNTRGLMETLIDLKGESHDALLYLPLPFHCVLVCWCHLPRLQG